MAAAVAAEVAAAVGGRRDEGLLMSRWTDVARSIAEDGLATIGWSCQYQGQAGTKEIDATFSLEDAIFGEARGAMERRMVVRLALSQVPDPRRGDKIIDPDGVIWSLEEPAPGPSAATTSWYAHKD